MSQPGAKRNRVLVIDDEPAVLEEYVHSLGEQPGNDARASSLATMEAELFGKAPSVETRRVFEVTTRTQGEQAIEAVQAAMDAEDPYAVAFLDVNMPPGMSGVDAARNIRHIDPDLNIVIVTGMASAEPERLAAHVPPKERLFFFQKPFHGIECRQLAMALCGKWHADRAMRTSHERLEQRVAERTAELHELAYFDPATGLPNRNSLIDGLQELIATAQRDETLVAVVLLDIERFSFINETLGYEAGTQLLTLWASRLKEVLRGNDIAGRCGSDEFACLLGDIGSEAALREVVREVERAFRAPFHLAERELHVGASIGVACYPGDGAEAHDVFGCAEAALNRSKRHALRRTVYYRHEMGESSRRQLHMEARLRTAIAHGDVQPYFQPQFSLTEQTTVGAEALARWVDEDGRVMPPSDFIPLAEEVKLSTALFECMLAQSLTHVAAMHKTGIEIPVSLNVSVHDLRQPRFVKTILCALQAAGVAPGMLKLELTETMLADDLNLARRVLDELVGHGIGIEVDDFGTGYSSLSYLAELPVESLKIDRSFVSGTEPGEEQQRVVQAIVALGHAFGLRVIAEGVETTQQLEHLREYGCDTVQGFLIARPMPAAEFPAWLAAQASPPHVVRRRHGEATALDLA